MSWSTSAGEMCRMFTSADAQRELFTRWHNCAVAARAAGHAADEAELIAFGKLLTFMLNLGYAMESNT